MSWLARSIANTLKLDDNDGDQSNKTTNINQEEAKNEYPKSATEQDNDPSSPTSPSRGVKEDISELTKTLSRQFWGVASFLAPPPQSEPYEPLQDSDPNKLDEKLKLDSGSDPEGSDQVAVAGIRSDFAEIGGRFRSGIERLSTNKAVTEFTKIASNFLQLGSDNGEEEAKGNYLSRGAVGVSEDVVAFARDIAMHPETWLDFPLPGNDDDDEFDMSDAQQEHALAVEQLAPRLAALRIELCPGYMSEACFWKIYFVLLHPRLEKQDAEILSTPQIVKARALLSLQLQKPAKEKQQDWCEKCAVNAKDGTDTQPEETLSVPPSKTVSGNVPITSVESATSTSAADSETDKQPVTSTEIEIVDKSAIEEKHVDQVKDGSSRSDSSNLLVDKDEDDGDDWLKEESSEVGGGSGATISIENEDDVSFSDLEEDDGDAPSNFKKISYSSDKDSRDWVQLSKSSADTSKNTYGLDVERAGSKKVMPNNSEMKDSSDWLDVDDIDVA